MREAAERRTWLEAGWTRAVTVVIALFVVLSGELLLAAFGGGRLTKLDVVAGLFAAVASLALLAAVSGRKLPGRQWVIIGFAYMLLLILVASVGRYEAGPLITRGWAAASILVVVFPVMFPASPLTALAFGVCAIFVDVGVALAYGSFAGNLDQFVGHYHGYLMGALLSVALAYIVQNIGNEELTSNNLGSYALVEKLGEGGMGEVWRADHALLKRGAAVKLIHPQRARDAKSRVADRRRFEREVQSASRLSSPYTVEVFDYGEREDGVLWFAMELIDGLDLIELTLRNRPMPSERVVFILRQVCFSLSEAHEHGLVHRDIKPNNVMVGRMGAEYDFVKVMDFGLVKTKRGREPDISVLTSRDGEGRGLTRQGATPGTPGFMAPEQIVSPSDVDARADVYGVGCLAYFMVTGQLVFEGDDREEVEQAHVSAPVVPPSQRAESDLCPEMDAVILRCLEKDPDDRFQSVDALADALARVPVEEEWSRGRARDAWRGHAFESTDWTEAD